jgi:DNA replication protein DnaC
MNDELHWMTKQLRLYRLASHWDEYVELARKQRYSAAKILQHVIEQEYAAKCENSRQLRRQRANIPEELELETYPFKRQPKLDRKRIQALYDGFDYMEKCRNIVWLGPTGCGKTGLATAFLLQAIDRGYRGYFITFPELIDRLFKSMADHSQDKVFRRFASFDCLVIDEVGYVEVEPAQVGQFFTLMQRRHKTKTTLITSNLGFAEWDTFLRNQHLTAALIDRLTEDSHVINMKGCVSLRTKLAE